MKIKIKSLITLMLVFCMSLSIMACGSYKYNYTGENFKVQYDEELLQITPCESEYEDIFVQPQDGYFIAYVDVALIDEHYSDPKVILDHMQKYFLSETIDGTVTNESVTTSTGRYEKSSTSIVEYKYTIESEETTQIITSKVESIGQNHFVVIYRYYDGYYTEKTLNALQLAYDSAKLDL